MRNGSPPEELIKAPYWKLFRRRCAPLFSLH